MIIHIVIFKVFIKQLQKIKMENRKYELYLSGTGTFIYVNYVDSETGIVGNYTIVDDQII